MNPVDLNDDKYNIIIDGHTFCADCSLSIVDLLDDLSHRLYYAHQERRPAILGPQDIGAVMAAQQWMAQAIGVLANYEEVVYSLTT